MRLILLLFLFSFTSESISQDTLIHPVDGLGSERFILFDDGSCMFKSSLCGHTFVSIGTYRKTLWGIKFSYDTTKCPKQIMINNSCNDKTDSVKISFYNLLDSTPDITWGTIISEKFKIQYDSKAITISKKLIINDSLNLHLYNLQQIKIPCNKTDCSIDAYLAPFIYSCGMCEINRLTKTNDGYKYKTHTYDPIEDKPWRKGKRRRVTHIFRKEN